MWITLVGALVFGAGYGCATAIFNPRMLQAFGPRGPAMLSLLNHPEDQRTSRVFHRIVHTQDIGGLWYARAELFHALCQRHDELHAARCLQALEPLFKPHLPQARQCPRRPGPAHLAGRPPA